MNIRAISFIFLAAVSISQAQLVRVPNTSIHLPENLGSSYVVEDAFGPNSKFTQPLCIVSPPGEKDRFFILEKGGRIMLVTRSGDTYSRSLFFDINQYLASRHEGTLPTANEWGLLGLAFHPDFAHNGFFYLAYDITVAATGEKKDYDRLARFTCSKSNPSTVDPDSEVPMITQLDLAPNHDGGDLHFGSDGYLYYSMGDEGAGNDSFDNARFIDKDFFAAIFRLDVDRKPGNLEPNPHSQNSLAFPSAVHPGTYKVPADNPYIKTPRHNGKDLASDKIRTEMWASGLRNVWRFSFDYPTGRLFAGDVGQNRWEEIDLITRGGFYGWSYFEGTHPGPRIKSLPPDTNSILPIYDYVHGPGSVFNGNCIIGGCVSHASRFPELEGTYLFGDYSARTIWSLRQTGAKWTPSVVTTSAGDIVAFGVDGRGGDILLADLSGRVGRLVRSNGPQKLPPPLLSQAGIFQSLSTLEPNPGVVPYKPNLEQWSGPVTARRWFSLPGSSILKFVRDGDWAFPPGAVWVQHFDTPEGKKLETRLLVKTKDDCYGLDYRWRADQTDADLVPDTGSDAAAASGFPAHRFPGRAECSACHTPVAGFALGFKTAQLSPAFIRPLISAGFLKASEKELQNLPAFAAPGDASQPLEWRARSYLAVNCVQCHQPGGAGGGNWDARYTTPTPAANIVDGPLVNTLGDTANRFMVPGDPARSMVLKRLEGKTAPRMPQFGPPETDDQAIRLLTEWINAPAPPRAAP